MAEKEPATGDETDGRQGGGNQPDLPPAAQRALREAEERRREAAERDREQDKKREIDGRGGLDPVRYGDWENKGIISDF